MDAYKLIDLIHNVNEKFFVYKISNKINKKFYIGSSGAIVQRLKSHASALARKIHQNTLINEDLKYYAYEDYDFRILAKFTNHDEMLTREQKLISMYWGTEKCYNLNFEVLDGVVSDAVFAWNLHTLEGRHYLTCHAASIDLKIRKDIVKEILNKNRIEHRNWVIEKWSEIRSIAELNEIYKISKKKTWPITCLSRNLSSTPLSIIRRYFQQI